MNKYTWSGGIHESVLLKVVAFSGEMEDQPNDLVIRKKEGYSIVEIDASERFMVNLEIDGRWIASLCAHEVC